MRALPRRHVRRAHAHDLPASWRDRASAGASWVAGTIVWTQISLLTVTVVLAVLFRHSPVLITGASMSPQIDVGDALIVDKPAVDTDVLGRVVVFSSSGERIAHRVVGEPEPGVYRTRGDANLDADSTPVPHTAIEGRARFVVPYVGQPAVWIRDAEWLAFGLWAGCFAVCAMVARLERSHEVWRVYPGRSWRGRRA